MSNEEPKIGARSKDSTTSTSRGNGGGGGGGKKEVVTVNGRYGTTRVEPGDEADIGIGEVEMVITFDGAVDYNGDAWLGHITTTEISGEKVIEDIEDRVEDYEVEYL